MPANISKLLPLYLVIFISFVGYSLMLTVFTPMLLHGNSFELPKNISPTVVLGILLALYPLGQFFSAPILGALSDRFGRKPVLMISLCVGLLCYIFIAISLMINNLTLLMISLLLAGLAEANVAIAQSAIADVSHHSDRARLFGYIALSTSLSYVVAPLVGGRLVILFGNAAAFWGVCILLFVAIVWAGLVFRETKNKEDLKAVSYWQAFTNLFSVFTDSRLRPLYLTNFLLYLAMFGFFRCYPMYLVDEFHMNVSQLSIFVAWVSVPIILANFGLVGFLSKRFCLKKITIFVGFFVGVLMWLLIVIRFYDLLWVTLFLPALMIAIGLPVSSALLSAAAGPSEQGQVMGNNQALAVGAEAISAVVGGLLAAIVVILPMIVLGLVAIVAAGILFFKKNN